MLAVVVPTDLAAAPPENPAETPHLVPDALKEWELMFTQPRMIRCKKCKRVFSDYADHCPDCHAKSPRGWVGFIVPILSVVIAIIAIAWTLYVWRYQAPKP